MFRVSKKTFYPNGMLNFIQRLFYRFEKYRHQSHQKVMNHLHTKKYHRVSYIQIFLLLIMFYLYTVITFTQGQEVEGTVPPSEAPIVIQNEPQIIPEQPQAETVLT